MSLSSLASRLRQGATGQTMTEYALILAAVTIVVFVTYQMMGQSIGSLVSSVDALLSAT
jgi:Flp pilus assembly pilin Flp